VCTVFQGRNELMHERVTLLAADYQGISSAPERVALEYRTTLADGGLRELLAMSWDRDRAAQHTTVGIHKDDLVFTLDGEPLKRFGSQGQQKTYLIALKLAQFDLTQARSGNRPIMLLDDTFDKIDPQR